MTEREKMMAGLDYDSRDEELIELYHRAKAILNEYDCTLSTDGKRKYELLKELLGEAGEGVWIEKTFSCDYGSNIYIGKNTFINYNCVFIDNNEIRIGEDCQLGPAVQIYTSMHPKKASERSLINEDGSVMHVTSTKPVTIGKNCWIGGGSVICPGVTIGDHVVIGAGSVVTRDIPDYALAYGVPCRVQEYTND